MENGTTYVGLDVDKERLHVAVLKAGEGEPQEWETPHEEGAIRRMVRKVLRERGGEVRFCYEAGAFGYALQRRIEALGAACTVVAPALIPVKPGDRVKTDRRDARKLAEYLRAGLLTPVHAPGAQDEAVRDLCRCREDAREDLLRCRNRLGKFLLRRGIRWTGGKKNWTQAHYQWLQGLRWEQEADRMVFEDYRLAIQQLEERIRTIEAQMEKIAGEAPYGEAISRLRCMRGIDTLTAVTIVAELHDFRRFDSPRGLMAYLGLTPSERSSGARTRRGSITKTGNRHARRVLVEAAWHYRHPVAIGAGWRKRREGQPPAVLAVADRAAHRLNRRYWKLVLAGKPTTKAVVAVARELAGFIWALLYPTAA